MAADAVITRTIDDYLAPSKQASNSNSSGKTKSLDVVTIGFEDKISIMAYTNGRISKLYYVPLLASPVPTHLINPMSSSAYTSGGGGGDYDDDGNFVEDAQDDTSFLPLPYLTPMPLLGASTAETDWGSIYAAQIASLVARQAPEDRRIVVVGLGPDVGPRPGQEVEMEHRKEFLEVVKLVEASRVW